LLSLVPPFFAAIAGLMEAQVKTAPRRLNAQEIRATELRLTEALHELETAAIPDALNHFDLNPGNAIVCGRECKFVDWAEAAIGNPFFSFEYLLQHFVRVVGDGADAAAEVRKSYVDVWRTVLSHSAVERTCELMPLIAPFAFAATLPWNDVLSDTNSEFGGLLRTLARRMHREAEQLFCRVA
jgi:aminoglycoside phosphotransferase (APT) family kinase protein